MSFDRVAAIYDETRVLPADALARVVDRVLEATNATLETRFLELGVGTGRVAWPFIERGYNYTGVDISPLMMERLRARAGDAANLTLLESPVEDLPFADNSFDVILNVHLLHLVPAWRQALDEARRVLAPGGYFITGGDRGREQDPASAIRHHWRELVAAAGVDLRPADGSMTAIDEALTERGAFIAVYRPAGWVREIRSIDILEAQVSHTFSESWTVSDDVLQSVHQGMLTWTAETYGDLDAALPCQFEFLLSIARFPD